MGRPRTKAPADPEAQADLAMIAQLEAGIIAAHEEKVHLGVPPEEIAAQREAVTTLAASVAERLRFEYHERRKVKP